MHIFVKKRTDLPLRQTKTKLSSDPFCSLHISSNTRHQRKCFVLW